MSTVNTNIADYLTRIETLTNTNLQILKTLNDSFFTKKDHLFAEVNDTTYVIPSFISLENKINALKENFENLVHAPETGEAFFNFDGNSRAIEVRKYNYTPDTVELKNVTMFDSMSNDIFKDFLTPVPYINFDLPNLPNDIVEVNVKKIIPKTDAVKNIFSGKLTEGAASVHVTYGDLYKLLLPYTEDVDYTEYDTVYKLPIRKSVGTGSYIIESVVSDAITDDLDEIITLKLTSDSKLTYKLFDDTIEKPLKVGDELINFDGSGKVVITDIRTSTNTIKVKVVNGEYLNFLGIDSYDHDNMKDIHDLSKLRFYSNVDFEKYVKVPLEEDEYVFIAIAPVNSRMNMQSPWGTGLMINTSLLTNSGGVDFGTYYNSVKNIGDALYEITAMNTSPIHNLSKDEFKKLTEYKPTGLEDHLQVVVINDHLNNSTTVKNIRSAYDQKKRAESELNEVQKEIDGINSLLTSISFEDTSNTRAIYTGQLTTLNNKKNELLQTINDAINSISINVNAAEVPIENAKHRIRGFYVCDEKSVSKENVIGINVQYCYRNNSTHLLNDKVITDIPFSHWNVLNVPYKNKLVTLENNGEYSYKFSDYKKDNENLPVYNQIDIPISQGEVVDLRVQLVYDYGQPYVTMVSDWSDTISIDFPGEFTKDVPVLTIIDENNKDIESNRFSSMLINNGVTAHINDSITDQDIIYYHRPDNIASGFYTAERRIIPLKDKLQSLSNEIAELKSEILGASGDNLTVSVSIGDNVTILDPNNDNIITLAPYNSFNDVGKYGVYEKYEKDGKEYVSVFANIRITNNSSNAAKLYSIFPGSRVTTLSSAENIKFNKSEYVEDATSSLNDKKIFLKYKVAGQVTENNPDNTEQTCNQFLTFRIKDAWTGKELNTAGNGIPSLSSDGLIVYPYLSNKTGLCLDSDNIRTYMTLNSGQELIVPIYCKYKLSSETKSETNKLLSDTKALSFDLRTSLYNDLINYRIDFVAKYEGSIEDQLNSGKLVNAKSGISHYNTTIM